MTPFSFSPLGILSLIETFTTGLLLDAKLFLQPDAAFSAPVRRAHEAIIGSIREASPDAARQAMLEDVRSVGAHLQKPADRPLKWR